MRIVYLHQYFNTAQVAGSTRSYEFARRLVRDGHDVHIVTSDRGASDTTSKWTLTKHEGINVHSIAIPYNNTMNARARVGAFAAFAAHSSMRARALRGDIVFATSTPLTIVLPALFATLARRTPFVMEVRDLWPSVPIAMGYLKNPVLRFGARLLERIAYRKACRIIALSDGMAKGVIANRGSSLGVSVITNLSDTSRFRAAHTRAEFDLRYPQLAGREFLVYTGTFGRVNGLEYMVKLAEAYAAHDKDFAFVAMGDGAEKSDVVELAEKLGILDESFFVFDAIPKSDIPLVLAAATACSSWIVPIEELEANSANKLFDSFAAGKPMVINHGGWQKELLESSGAGVALSSTDTTAAAESLSRRLLDEKWLLKAASASAGLGDEFEVEKLYGRFSDVLVSAHSEFRSGLVGDVSNQEVSNDQSV